MDRRSFMALTASVSLVPALGSAAQFYKPGLVKQLLTEGKTVFIDFTTEWCTTCASQKRTISALRGDNPEYDKHISFVTIDYDLFGQKGLAKELNIPRRSTLVVLKGDQEVGRIVAGTGTKLIKGLMDKALAAASV